MKFVAIFLVVISLTARSQPNELLNKKVTLNYIDAEFSLVLRSITHQTGIQFNYTSDILEKVGKVTLNVRDCKVKKVLDHSLKKTQLIYEPLGIVIGIRLKKEVILQDASPEYIQAKVAVIDERNNPLSGADIKLSNKPGFIRTNIEGEASFAVQTPVKITITSPGYITIDTLINIINPHISVQMRSAMERTLDEVFVIAYGKTTRRLATGVISKVSTTELENHHARDIFSVLSGRIPRLLITQINGLPESYFKVQLDGQTSVGTIPGRLPFTDPLFVIDGVPFASNNNNLLMVGSGSALGGYGRSPISFIDPTHIASIEVFKDADGTAIYGSRGARGVVLITTKQGVPGKLQVTGDIRYGIGMPTKIANMLNTRQYLLMRNEALRNDTVSPIMARDKDLLVYDSTRYTNFRKEFLNKQIRSKDATFTFSGSKDNIVYYFGTNYHKESTVFPGSFGNKFFSIHFHSFYKSPNQKFYTALSGNYLIDANDLNSTDVTQTLLLPPNSPSLRNAENKTNWGNSITAFNNPVAFLDQKYHSLTDNSLVSLQLNYQLFKKICFKATLGHNGIWSSENSILPIVSINPYDGSTLKGTAYFGKNTYQSWIAEPHIEFKDSIGKGVITMLLGNTWQRITNENKKITASGYLTDENYSNTNGADSVSVLAPPKNIYQYQGMFSRIIFNRQDKYIGSLTGRIDWAKRFGLAPIYRPLAALAVGWIFSRESFLKKMKLISFGKLRTSYGITGNDPIGDMQYFDGWSRSNTNSYRDQLAHDKLSTEITQKLNIGLDVGLLHDRLFLTMNYFNNLSSNLLIAPEISVNPGSNSNLKNWPAKIKNTGLDFTLRYENKSTHKLRWSGEVIITLPHNKLISFHNLAGSPYAGILHEGKSLTMQQGYRYLGVNNETGVFSFKDKNNDGLITYDHDLDLIGHLDPKAYGGLKYDMSYKKFRFGFFIEGRVQTGYNFQSAILADATPGMAMLNQPVEVLGRWQKPGDKAIFQKFTTGKNSNVITANELFMQSDGRYANASFVRLKNIYFSGGLPTGWLKKLHLAGGSIYIQANNALTITKFRLLDPETQSLTTLPPIKSFLIGFKWSF